MILHPKNNNHDIKYQLINYKFIIYLQIQNSNAVKHYYDSADSAYQSDDYRKVLKYIFSYYTGHSFHEISKCILFRVTFILFTTGTVQSSEYFPIKIWQANLIFRLFI